MALRHVRPNDPAGCAQDVVDFGVPATLQTPIFERIQLYEASHTSSMPLKRLVLAFRRGRL
jgi:hypothetical protein